MSIRTGLDRLLDHPEWLGGRQYALLSHSAAVAANGNPIHRALAESGCPAPTLLFGPEHGFYGVEQDMVAAADGRDPWTGVAVQSLYGESEATLRPDPQQFAAVDLLLVDLQDVGARYYTYAATAVWAAAVALEVGCEVWVLDRPNPLGGHRVEGPLRQPGFDSFVGAFSTPVRHGLTLGELLELEARRAEWPENWKVVRVEGWGRDELWPTLQRPWVPPSPNLPTFDGAVLYPGLCLVEGTTLSEGRGTTQPFQLVGAPGVDAVGVAEQLNPPGVQVVPTFFRPQFQKHRGEVCSGVALRVVDPAAVRSLRLGVDLLQAFHEVSPEAFGWRDEAYEFVTDVPAIDLLAGSDALRKGIERRDGTLSHWLEGWAADEEAFVAEVQSHLLYPMDD